MCMYIYMYWNICIYKCISLYVNIHIRIYDIYISLSLSIYLSIYLFIYLSAEPCRQQGECVREEGTRGARGKRKDCHGALALGRVLDRSCAGRKPAARGRKQVGSKKHGALTGPAQEEGQLRERASKLAASS